MNDLLKYLAMACVAGALLVPGFHGHSTCLATPAPASADAKRDLLAEASAAIRELLAGQLEGHEFKGEAKKRVVAVSLTAKATAIFTDPGRKLKLQITSVERSGPKAVTVVVKASCPASGKLTADANPGPKVSTKFTTTANLEVTFRASWAGGNGTSLTITQWSGKLTGTDFKNPVLRLLEGVAQRAANAVIRKENAKLKEKVNAALEKAVQKSNVRDLLDKYAK